MDAAPVLAARRAEKPPRPPAGDHLGRGHGVVAVEDLLGGVLGEAPLDEEPHERVVEWQAHREAGDAVLHPLVDEVGEQPLAGDVGTALGDRAEVDDVPRLRLPGDAVGLDEADDLAARVLGDEEVARRLRGRDQRGQRPSHRVPEAYQGGVGHGAVARRERR